MQGPRAMTLSARSREVGQSANAAIEEPAGGEYAESDGDIGVHVHFPDHILGEDRERVSPRCRRAGEVAGW